MDELKIKTKLMRGMLSKVIEMLIHTKTEYKVKIQLNDVDVTINESVAHIHLDVDGDMSVNEFTKVQRILGTED